MGGKKTMMGPKNGWVGILLRMICNDWHAMISRLLTKWWTINQGRVFGIQKGVFWARKPESRPYRGLSCNSSRSRGLMELHYDSMRKKAQVRDTGSGKVRTVCFCVIKLIWKCLKKTGEKELRMGFFETLAKFQKICPPRELVFFCFWKSKPAASEEFRSAPSVRPSWWAPVWIESGSSNPRVCEKYHGKRLVMWPKTLSKMRCKPRRILLVPATVWTP